ncbi:MAG: sugar ABC transporter permease [Acidimicrobiales bacterium]
MQTLERSDSTSEEPAGRSGNGALRRNRTTRENLVIAAAAAVVVGLVIWSFFEPKIRTTSFTVVVAVAASGGLWVGANLLFDQVRDNYQRFNAIAFAAVGALVGVVIHGNLLTVGSGAGFLPWVLGPLAGAASFGAVGLGLALNDDPRRRLAIGLARSGVIGLAIGLLIRDVYHPGLDVVAIIAYTVVLAGIGGGLSLLRKRPPVAGVLVGAAIGWVLGAWGGADLGGGSILTSVVATLPAALLIGARLGLSKNLDYGGRIALDAKSRATIFVGPALLFIFVLLVIPAIRTAYLSLLGRDSEQWVGLDNYTTVFTDRNSLDLENWTWMFTSIPFLIGVGVLLIALVVGIVMKRTTGYAVEIGNPTMAPLIVGLLLLSFGVFTALRGTIINNMWWVVVVTFGSTAMGLAIAVFADQRAGERVAKSIVFMPMAISLVGASIIWRFVYAARDTSTEQTGVLNALWVGLGRLSTGSGLPTLIITAVLIAILLGLFVMLAVNLTRHGIGRAVVPAVLILLVGWFFVRFVGLFGTVGVGGFRVAEDGEISAQTVNFVQETPYNNFWLMIIMVWIQTGFAMVILSAAMKAVPTEYIEAAKIDGATDAQVFWRVTLPQIATTIGVVVTTTIVGVMKVFDIVKVTTNGQFGSQVLANNMFQEAFSFNDTGKGAALAILIFLSVLPIMYSNIRRMQREG